MQDSATFSRSEGYAAFLVRLWQDSPQAAWRASAQPTLDGEIIRFADLDGLFAFLSARTAGWTGANAQPPNVDSPGE